MTVQHGARNSQAGILSELPGHASYLEFDLWENAESGELTDVLLNLAKIVDGTQCVLGIGQPVVQALSRQIAGLTDAPGFSGAQRVTPVTQAALWLWLRGEDRGVLANQSRELTNRLDRVFSRVRLFDGFKYDTGRDLTGYEDGTENPTGDAAAEAALADDGSSFVAVQQWVHDFGRFDAMTLVQQDEAIGRHKESNEEFDAPASAHVKRTAQEDFDPEAFLVRRSMPWADQHGSGLMFVAFGRTFGAFEAQMTRMLGLDDGIEDALYQFTAPITSAYYWCPPVKDGSIDLSALVS